MAGLFAAAPLLAARIPEPRRARLIELVKRVQLVPLVENVGALAHLPELLEDLQPDAPAVRVFVAMSDTAESSGKIATDLAYTLALASPEAIPRKVTFLIGAGRAGFRGGFDPEHPRVLPPVSRTPRLPRHASPPAPPAPAQ